MNNSDEYVSRLLKCFDEGIQAFKDGIDRSDCPFRTGPKEGPFRHYWLMGWDDSEKNAQKHG